MRDGAGPSQTGRLKSNVEERGENGSAYSKERWDTLKTPEEEEEKKQLYLTLRFAFQSRKYTERKEVKKEDLITGGT